MEAVQRSNVKMPNSLLITGLTDTESDEELFDFLKQYGSIQTMVPVDPPCPEKGKQSFLEYASSAPVQALSSLLPYRFSPKNKPDILYLVEALSSVYSPVVSKAATQTYLTELRDIARLIGKDFADLLDELSSTSQVVNPDENDSGDRQDSPQVPDTNAPLSPLQENPPTLEPVHPLIQAPVENPPQVQVNVKTPTLKPSEVNPPELQKVIVEHVLRTEDFNAQMNTPFRLRPFSGRCPHPNNEVDYESWRSSVELLLKDPRQPDSCKSRRLLESLSSPAVDLVKHIPTESPPSTYLKILDSAFGTVEDGDDLFAKYLNTVQNNGEAPSSYLQRLQVMLNTTFIRGGVPAGELDKQKRQIPPNFSELLLMLRTAEKQHLNTTKPKVFSNYQGAQSQSPERDTSKTVDPLSEIQDLKKQIANLQSHLASLKNKKDSNSKVKSKSTNSTKTKVPPESLKTPKPQPSEQKSEPHPRNRPKPWYCFRCGEDGHIKPQCENEPNSPLVAEKKKLLRDKQIAWDKVNGQEPTFLN
ncbi:zinc finger CCHC domain-containing protein 12-like [Oryzias latipes]|uniref:zinc finger CCHC domain-containing protein 12-like n=1 Tax=Oryzias latipes TaxID=8090 RepID=UPI000CE27598|nr:zinc finger CCHC domain-containing protein 12-like [Oryzias latipes]